MALDELLRKQREGEDISQNDIAKSSIELINQLCRYSIKYKPVPLIHFLSSLTSLAHFYPGKPRLSSVGGKLQNLPDLGAPWGWAGCCLRNSVLLYQQALFWGNSDATYRNKSCSGYRTDNFRFLEMLVKLFRNIFLAQRMAQGLSTTAASAGLITSAVCWLSVLFLSWLLQINLRRAKQLESYSERFKKLNYEGDALLAAFHKETGGYRCSPDNNKYCPEFCICGS